MEVGYIRVTHFIVGEKPVLIGALQHISRPRIRTFRRSRLTGQVRGHLERGCLLHAIPATGPRSAPGARRDFLARALPTTT